MDSSKASPGEQDSGRLSEATARRLALYVVVVTAALMVLALAATVALGALWMSWLEPVSDGQRVLEVMQEPAPEPEAH